jgi:uncharacterized membrane protein
MTSLITPQNSALAVGFVSLLDPLPIGFFTAAQAASWLIVFGLLIAIIPRLINLVQVWVGTSYPQSSAVKLHFWASALAIILSIFNAFIHSRDAFAVVPAGVTLSSLVVLLLLIANLQLALRQRKAYGEAK